MFLLQTEMTWIVWIGNEDVCEINDIDERQKLQIINKHSSITLTGSADLDRRPAGASVEAGSGRGTGLTYTCQHTRSKYNKT